ncbi:MAG: ABC transporter permease [Albidovulum sp.]|nr:ABC transporter permease [Albidovulum sp.]
MTRRRSDNSWHLVLLPAATLTVFFVIPFTIMLAVSFFQRIEGGFFEPAFVLSNYVRFLTPFFGKILATSVGLSATAATIVVAVAFPFAYVLSRMPRRRQTTILVFILSVLSLSEVIVGFAWSTLLSRTAGIGNLFHWVGIAESPRAYTPGLASLLLGLAYLAFPYAVLVIYPAVSRLDPELPEAARTSGASPLRAFTSVTLPIMRRTIAGALILVFVFTLGAYLLPQVLGRPRHWTLPVHITDQAIFQSNIPFAAAMAMFLLLVSLALVGLVLVVDSRRRGDQS